MRSTQRLATILVVTSFLAAACGDSKSNTDGTDSTSDNGSIGTTTTALEKPLVSLPSATPTELEVTELIAGRGPAAATGDEVIVHYVGVLSADGQEFDSSYAAEPIRFLLGAGNVILGWDRGLTGAQQGARLQLDIPADFAYGDRPPNGGSGLIKAGAALSFVVDVVAVLPRSNAADEPQITLAPAENIPVLQSIDLVEGDGATPQDGQTVAIQIMTFRADTGEMVASDWGGPPLTFSYSAQTNVFPGLLAAVKDMKVGGRRQTQLPFLLMFDGEGSAGFGIPAGVDVVVVIDLIAAW